MFIVHNSLPDTEPINTVTRTRRGMFPTVLGPKPPTLNKRKTVGRAE